MDIRQFDVVLLKTKEEATVLEIHEDKIHFLVEFDDNSDRVVNISDIEKVVWIAPQDPPHKK